MKKLILLFLVLQFNVPLWAQQIQFGQAEDSLFTLQQMVKEASEDAVKLQLNRTFQSVLKQTLLLPNSINYPFDSLKSIAILSPKDNSFRIFNWELSLTDNSILYFGMIQTYNKVKQKFEITELTDQSLSLKRPENQQLDAANWYGAHYYKLIETQFRKSIFRKNASNNKKYYTLLGANWSNLLIRKKIIDVLVIGKDGKIKFGENVFLTNKNSSRRVIFSYSSEVSCSLRYDENKGLILVDHLVPREANLTGQYEFYGPDMSIDAYDFVKGKWLYKADVDARNEKR
ncbi:MAG TPA: hypothetical protein PLI68_11995 [Bacteroidia bacterium]|nr:hypothetical protein [Bacteroidia bacterium]HRH08418.1 hypothetical protein [Bacteroidia bacterium]HRH64038.1 hypothetical protein [Bacteroidia bacterium]